MSVTPQFIGQYYENTSNKNLWKSNSLTPGDWRLERGGNKLGLFSYGDSGTVGALVITDLTTNVGYDIESEPNITSISFPYLVSIDPTNLQYGYLSCYGCSSLTSFSAPLLSDVGYGVAIGPSVALASVDLSSLIHCGGALSIHQCGGLTSLDLSSFVTSDTGLTIDGNTLLVSVDLSSYIPTNGHLLVFPGNAFNTATVDLILARAVANAAYVSGSIDLTGGTNSSPTSTGVGSDYAILIGRGVIVSVNP